MKYLIQDGMLEAYNKKTAIEEGKPYIWMIGSPELQTASETLRLSEALVQEMRSGDVTKFESHEGFDFIVLNIPTDLFTEGRSQRVCMYLSVNLLALFCEKDAVFESMLSDNSREPRKKTSLARIMYQYFDRVTYDDSLILKKIEQDISALEETLIVSKKSDFLFLVDYRKKLLELKVYYEQLLEVFEAIEQNENGLIEMKEIRFFRILAGRVNRLYNGVNNLRDFVTQVREAYQTQIDINLNSVMKVFTVITSIFFPLTLIVGWYGMNFVEVR